MAWYAADGSLNITIVSGAARTGVYAADGSVNTVVSDGNDARGAYHPCGAWWIAVAPTIKGFRAPDGSMNVSATPYTGGGQRVTVVSGSL
jgi:hypothetical protein